MVDMKKPKLVSEISDDQIEREDLPEKYKNKTTFVQKANNFFFQSDIQKSKLATSMTGSEIFKEDQAQQSEALFKKASLAEQKLGHEKDEPEKVLSSRANRYEAEPAGQKLENFGGQTFDDEDIQFGNVDEEVEKNKNSS